MNTNDRLFLALLAYSAGGGEVPDISGMSSRDLTRITARARSHRVLPLIGEALAACPDFAERFPEEYAHIRSEVLRQIAEQLRREAELFRVLDGLSAAGIRAAVIKGAVCRAMYPRPDWRTSSDEDLLINAADFTAAEGCLLNAGFVRTSGGIGTVPEVHAAYRHPRSGLVLEVHVRLFVSGTDAERRLNIPFEESLSRCEELPTPGGTLLTLSPEDNLLFLICHSMKHFMYTGFGVRQITDILVFTGQYKDRLDLKYVCDMMCRINGRGFLAAVADIGLKYFPGISAACGEIIGYCGCRPDGDGMLEDVLAAGAYGKASADRERSGLITLRALSDADSAEPARAGGGSLWSLMFPKRIIIQRRYGYLNKYPWLLPVAWLQRIWSYCFGGNRDGNRYLTNKSSVALGRRRVALLEKYGILNGADGAAEPESMTRRN